MDVAAPSKFRAVVPGGRRWLAQARTVMWGKWRCSSIPHFAEVLVRSLKHIIVRGRLIFVVIRIHVISAHRMVRELVPHQKAPQVGVSVKDDSEEIKYLAFLKLGAAPNRGERRQVDAVSAVLGAQAQWKRAVLLLHRDEVIDDFEVAGGS